MTEGAGGPVAGTVVVEVIANLDGYNRQMDAAKVKATDLDKNTTKAAQSITKTFSGVSQAAVTVTVSTGKVGAAAADAEKKLSGLGRVAATVRSGFASIGTAATALLAPLRSIAGFAGIVGIGLSVKEALVGFAEWEQRMLTINAVLRATGQASGQTADSIRTLAEEIEGSTLAGSDAVERAAVTLTSFRTIANDVFQDTLRLSQDLAATGFGNIETAAFTLGQALENPIEGMARLRRAGIVFTEAQKQVIQHLIETGRTAEAQRMILDKLQNTVGGAGQQQATGLTGAFHKFREAISRWLEIMGEWATKNTDLVRILTAIAGAIERYNREASPQTLEDKASNATNAVERATAALSKYSGEVVLAQLEVAKYSTALEHTRNVQELNIQTLKDMGTAYSRGDISARQLRQANEAVLQTGDRIAMLDAKRKEALVELENAQNRAKTAQEGVTNAMREQALIGKELDSSQIEGYYKGVEASAAAAKEKVDGVIASLMKQKQLAGLSPVARTTLEKQQEAGVLPNSPEGRQIAGLVKGIDLASGGGGGLSPYDQFKQSLMTQEQLENDSFKRRMEQIRAFQSDRGLSQQETDSLIEAAFTQHSAKMMEIQLQQSAGVINAAMGAGQALEGVLSQLGEKNKAAAIAAIAVNTALQVAQTIQNTAAAAVRALAELGPIAGPPAAAAIAAFGAAQVGLILAAGVLRATGNRSAGSGAPTSSRGGRSQTPTPSTTEPPKDFGRSLQIVIDPGKPWAPEAVMELVKEINNQVGNGTTLISSEIRRR